MNSTIQVSNDLKKTLLGLRVGSESFEEIIFGLIKQLELERKDRVELLIEGCIEMADENLKITSEFDKIEDLNSVEW